MNSLLIVIPLAVIALSAFARWVASPAIVGLRLGVDCGRMLEASKPDAEPPVRSWRWLAAVVFAWLMPWQAVRVIRTERRDKRVCIEALAYAATGTRKEAATRPTCAEWYDRPLPLAVLIALVRPVAAVRALRSGDDHLRYVCDAIVAHQREHHEADPAAGRGTGNPTGPQPQLTSF